MPYSSTEIRREDLQSCKLVHLKYGKSAPGDNQASTWGVHVVQSNLEPTAYVELFHDC